MGAQSQRTSGVVWCGTQTGHSPASFTSRVHDLSLLLVWTWSHVPQQCTHPTLKIYIRLMALRDNNTTSVVGTCRWSLFWLPRSPTKLRFEVSGPQNWTSCFTDKNYLAGDLRSKEKVSSVYIGQGQGTVMWAIKLNLLVPRPSWTRFNGTNSI